jgi:hypothetical protein
MTLSSRVPAPVRTLVTQALADQESITARDVAALVVAQACREIDVDAQRFPGSTLELLAARGATDFVKLVVKTAIDAVAGGDEATLPLFADLAGMVWIRVAGQDLFKRRDRLTQSEYRQMLVLLRRTSATLVTKIKRYQDEYDRVQSFWREGLTFGEAYAAMVQGAATEPPEAR